MWDSPHTVSDLMTRPAVAVGARADFKEIVETMRSRQVSAVPVLAGDGRVIGVVSEADLLPKEQFRGADQSRVELAAEREITKAEAVTAEGLMSSPAVTVQEEATASKAAQIMARRRVKRLPVLDAAGRLTGMVSRGDVLKVFLRPDEEIASEVRDVAVGSLFADVTPPVAVDVSGGVVTLKGRVPDVSRAPIAARLARSVEGVVDVECELSGRTPRRFTPPPGDPGSDP